MNLLLLGILIVFWWVGMWGLIESSVEMYAKTNLWKRIVAYASLVGIVIIFLILYPDHLERFV